METIAVQRSFEVAVPLDEAWTRLARVEQWPEWAPHITKVMLSPPGPLGPTSTGALHIRRFGPNRFRMSAWEPPNRWEWTGGLPGVRIAYHHGFKPSSDHTTTMTWTVTLHGPLAPLLQPFFARVYGGNVDRAIPRLQDWIRT
jgi:hypothetical protein